MKNIQLVDENKEYATISYEDEKGQIKKVILGGISVEIIKALGKALQKDSFLK